MGYDPSGYSARSNPMGYNYGGEYAAGYNANYANSYPYMSNPSYGGYPQQYNPAYGQQGYDQMAYGMAQGGVNASNPSASNPVPKSGEGSIPSTSQMSTNPSSQYPSANASYVPDAGYNSAGYNYNPADYAGGAGAGAGAGTGAGAGNYMGYNNVPGQGVDSSMAAGGRNMQGNKYPSNQAQSPSQMGSYPKSGQSGIGPDKGKFINLCSLFT